MASTSIDNPTPTHQPQRRMHSILRRKRAPSQSREPPASQTLRHSLSLPDLTTPLIDADAWEELPTFFSPPTEPNGLAKGKGSSGVGGGTTALTRGRKPSLIGTGNVQFHKPFRADSLNPPMSATSTQNGKGDFRLPFARWAKDTTGDEGGITEAGGRQGGRRAEHQDRTMSVVSRRRGRKANALGRLNVVVAGGKGVGKTSFINMLVQSLESSTPSPRSPVDSPSKRQTRSSSAEVTTPSAPTAPGAPRSTVGTPNLAPTTRLSSRVVVASLPDTEKTQLRIIDTPGLELGDEPLAAKERDRGVRGLLRMIEARFEETLREESKVIRTKARADDDVVHLILYLIDAGRVLRPPVQSTAVDWSGAGLFDDHAEQDKTTNTSSPQLSASDLETIRRLSERCNVLPVLSQIDGLTIGQLDDVRSVVRRDLARAMPEEAGRGFGIFLDEEDPESEEDVNGGASPAGAPPSPSASGTSGEGGPVLPYAIFSPETISNDGMERRFAWGAADVLNPKHSDFVVLREAILSTYIKTLRTNTREVLYEQFRTERLLAKRASGQ